MRLLICMTILLGVCSSYTQYEESDLSGNSEIVYNYGEVPEEHMHYNHNFPEHNISFIYTVQYANDNVFMFVMKDGSIRLLEMSSLNYMENYQLLELISSIDVSELQVVSNINTIKIKNSLEAVSKVTPKTIMKVDSNHADLDREQKYKNIYAVIDSEALVLFEFSRYYHKVSTDDSVSATVNWLEDLYLDIQPYITSDFFNVS